jgi:L-iditol 2-dehydrogenase
MKAAYFTALRRVEILDAPEPKLDRPDAALVRIERVGICRSDLHYYLEGRIGDQVVQYPATVGHECSGTVVEIGAEVQNVRPGDRVAVEPAFSCGTCDQCRAGRWNTCRKVRFMGAPGEVPGAAAEYRVLRAENCFPVPPNMSLDEAALVEPLSIGLYAVRGAGFQPAFFDQPEQASQRLTPRTSVVLGTGPIGLSVILCAKALAPCKIYATDLLDCRLEAARRCGADWTGNAHSGAMAQITQQEPLGVDVVFECCGDPACIDQGQRLLTPGGTLMMVGIPSTDEVSFNPHKMRRAELTFQAVRRQNACVAPAIKLVAEGRIDPSPLLTHHFPLERIGEAFELVAGYRDGVIKAMITL